VSTVSTTPSPPGGDGNRGQDVGEPVGDEQTVNAHLEPEHPYEDPQRRRVEEPVRGGPPHCAAEQAAVGAELPKACGQPVDELVEPPLVEEGQPAADCAHDPGGPFLPRVSISTSNETLRSARPRRRPRSRIAGRTPERDRDHEGQPQQDVQDDRRPDAWARGRSPCRTRTHRPAPAGGSRAQSPPPARRARWLTARSRAGCAGRSTAAVPGQAGPSGSGWRRRGSSDLGRDGQRHQCKLRVDQERGGLASTGDLRQDQVLHDQGEEEEGRGALKGFLPLGKRSGWVGAGVRSGGDIDPSGRSLDPFMVQTVALRHRQAERSAGCGLRHQPDPVRRRSRRRDLRGKPGAAGGGRSHAAGHRAGRTVARHDPLRSARAPTPARSFGYYRLEILTAVVNGALLLGASIAVVAWSVSRLIHPPAVSRGLVLGFGVAALADNGARCVAATWGAEGEPDVARRLPRLPRGRARGSCRRRCGVVMASTRFLRADVLVSMAIAPLIADRTADVAPARARRSTSCSRPAGRPGPGGRSDLGARGAQAPHGRPRRPPSAKGVSRPSLRSRALDLPARARYIPGSRAGDARLGPSTGLEAHDRTARTREALRRPNSKAKPNSR
jgi:Cation efflux family